MELVTNVHRPPSICIIGAGFSGITAGIQLIRKLKLESFMIYEQNTEIGGTWFVNRYPGVACDTPSYLYTWSFEPNPDWNEKYSSGNDILNYMKSIVKKYKLCSHIQFRTVVKSTTWDNKTKLWTVVLYNKRNQNTEILQYDYVITATGFLRSPKIPKEFQHFKGKIIHSANWDPNVELRNKIVGVVGCGASAIQIIPTIASAVQELHCYQRRPPHVLPRNQKTYSNRWKSICKKFPIIMWIIRLFTFIKFEFLYSTFIRNSLAFKLGSKRTKSYLEEQVKKERIRKLLNPGFEYGCKRILYHNYYYRTLQMAHVRVHRGEILDIVDRSVRCSDGSINNLDILVLATGFNTNDYLEPLKVYGERSVELNEIWKKNNPSAYLGLMTHSTPNHFIILGPNSLQDHSSFLYIAECQVDYMVKILERMMKTKSKSIKPKKECEQKYMSKLYAKLKKTTWHSFDCNSWYSDGKGNITALFPYRSIRYWMKTKFVHFNNYEISHK